jgi:AcrR family transcriptional regulator
MKTERLKPRKDARQRRSEQTVEAIVSAAAHLLERHGLSELNTNQIAHRAGVSIGSLYQYFPGKEAILAELLRRERQWLLEQLCAVSGRGHNALADAVDAFLHVAVAHQLRRPQLSRALEYVEKMLPLEKETASLTDQIVVEVTKILSAYAVPFAVVAACDVVAISRGMVDAAGMNGEKDAPRLHQRVRAAVLGYLEQVVQVEKAR